MSAIELRKQLAQDSKDIEEIRKKDQKNYDEMMELVKYDGTDKVISSYEALDIIKEKHSNVQTFKTGFNALDLKTEGFEEGELIVISGITANGKTTFAQSMTRNLAKTNINCLWFTYEVGIKNFIEKFGKDTPLFFLPQTLQSNTIQWIRKRIVESRFKYNTKIIVIDHLHYLIKLGQSASTSLLIGEIMRQLRYLALEQKIVIIIIAHTAKIKHETTPDLSDIRDSSFIAQESDTCMIIRRCGEMNKYTKEMIYYETANLYLLKNRRKGTLGKIELIMKDGLFHELETGGY